MDDELLRLKEKEAKARDQYTRFRNNKAVYDLSVIRAAKEILEEAVEALEVYCRRYERPSTD